MTLAEPLHDADDVVIDDVLPEMVDVRVTNDVGDPDSLPCGNRLNVANPV